MSRENTPSPFAPGGFRTRWWQRAVIYFGIWLAAALIIATRAEFYVPDQGDPPEAVSRMYLFAEAPLAVSSGLDVAAISALRQSPGQVGLLTWIFLIAFVCHALFTFACARRVSFIALIVVLIITLSIGVFYVLKFYHLDTT